LALSGIIIASMPVRADLQPRRAADESGWSLPSGQIDAGPQRIFNGESADEIFMAPLYHVENLDATQSHTMVSRPFHAISASA
jgi:hypothetical protein